MQVDIINTIVTGLNTAPARLNTAKTTGWTSVFQLKLDFGHLDENFLIKRS